MSGRGRLAICAVLATLAASCALLPLVDPATWLLQAALLTAVQAGVGAATRRVPLARPVTVLTQAVISLLLLTVVFAREHAPAGFLPSPAGFAHFGTLFDQGIQDVSRYAIPAPLTDGIRLMLVGGVLVIGLLVDTVAVTYRSAAPAGLPLLALYSVAAGLSQGGARWLWFLCAAGGYLLLLLAEGRERLSQWGRVFADRSRPGAAPHQPGSVGGLAMAPVRTGRRIGVLALGISLVVPAALPSLSGGLLDNVGTGGGGGGNKGGGTVSAVNPVVALKNSLNQPQNRTALTYSTDSDEKDLYLRIVALDKFDGAQWKPSERRIGEIPDPLPSPRGLGPDVRTRTVSSTIQASDAYAQDWLPMPYPASRVQVDGKWRFEPEGRTLVGYDKQTTRGLRYSVDSLRVQPTAEQLRNAPAAPPALKREYTAVPDSLPAVVPKTARKVTRGAKDDYDRAVLLQDWFADKGGFTYDTEVAAGTGANAIADFLKQKEGFCVHFSFAMASMARTLGIPARVAVGFTPGTARGDGKMEVGFQDAHAWPELYFEGVGWTRFEPTPTRGTTPPYAQPDSPDTDQNPSEELPDRSQDDQPSADPSPSEECSAQQKQSDPECGAAAPLPRSGSPDEGPPLGTIAAFGSAGLAVLGLLLLPMLLRMRRRSRRLRAPGAGSPEAVLVAWQELIDTGWDYGILPDDSATPRTAAARLARIGQLGPDDAEAVQRVALAVEQVLYAPVPRATAGVADEVRRIRAGLRAAAPRTVRIRALLLPPSTARLLWSATRRARALRARWTRALSRPRLAK
ncbi:transglutaminaseTgpA domain-containing protein [Streptomyces sp. 3N207]|uniref:transglutaminaseTgpA domain-containing protein n=1 Tax=Streptomyces sp. 3N207 TaxID=3457417 RepID=UPI003FD5C674